MGGDLTKQIRRVRKHSLLQCRGKIRKCTLKKEMIIYYTCIARPSHSIRVASGIHNNLWGFAEAIPWGKVDNKYKENGRN